MNTDYFGFKGRIKKQIASVINRLSEKINHDLNNWPPPTEWNRIGFYNNFFITKVDFWLRPDVQSLIHHFDRSGGIYKYRWNDLIFQTVAVQIFLPQSRVHKFTDWTYEHATFKNDKLDWGGIYPGMGDEENPTIQEFQKKFGKTRVEGSF